MTASPSTGLELADVRVDYGSHIAIEGVDLTVARGAVVALLGPSGCGKSTVLRAIAGLEPLVCGRVSWLGNDLAEVPVHERGIGMMFQDHALFPHRTVAENVAFGLRMRGIRSPARERRVDEMLELVGLGGAGPRSVGSLSGGQAQRVALARALAPKPDLLLLDEPLASLDRALRDRLVSEIRALVVELGVTAVHVTHDQDEAASIGDTVALMDGGRIQNTGVLGDLVDFPGDTVTAALLGLETVWRRPIREGRVSTPWGVMGAVGTTGSTAALLIPPRAVRFEAVAHSERSSDITAVVRSSRARAGEWLVTATLEDGSTVVALRSTRIPERTTVAVRVDLERIEILEDRSLTSR